MALFHGARTTPTERPTGGAATHGVTGKNWNWLSIAVQSGPTT